MRVNTFYLSRISSKSLAVAINATFVFCFSYFIGSQFILGDQLVYRSLYQGVDGLGLVDGYYWYISQVDSKEFGHYFLIWLASGCLDKDIFNAISNTVLAYFSTKLFLRWGAKPIIAVVLVSFGYYHLGMYLSAERLKYSFLFVTLSIYFYEKKHIFIVSLVLAVITHVQALIVYVTLYFEHYMESLLASFLTLRIKKIVFFSLLAASIFMIAFLLVFFEHILSKYEFYNERFGGIVALKQMVVFFILSLFYSGKKLRVILLFIPLVITVYLIGGMRVNLIGYFVFLFFALKVNGGVNVGVLSTSIYYTLGWSGYVLNVINFGVNTLPVIVK